MNSGSIQIKPLKHWKVVLISKRLHLVSKCKWKWDYLNENFWWLVSETIFILLYSCWIFLLCIFLSMGTDAQLRTRWHTSLLRSVAKLSRNEWSLNGIHLPYFRHVPELGKNRVRNRHHQRAADLFLNRDKMDQMHWLEAALFPTSTSKEACSH